MPQWQGGNTGLLYLVIQDACPLPFCCTRCPSRVNGPLGVVLGCPIATRQLGRPPLYWVCRHEGFQAAGWAGVPGEHWARPPCASISVASPTRAALHHILVPGCGPSV